MEMLMGKFIDISGQKFDRLKVISKYEHRRYVNGEILWQCECQCTDKTVVYACGSQLRQGRKKSCGCLKSPKDEEYFKKIAYKLETNSRMNGQCKEWNGYKKEGYGKICITRNGKEKSEFVHRVAWEIYKGKIPNGMNVCHTCDNPSCFRVDHLFLGTQKDNMQDKKNKKRQNIKKGEESHKSKLKESEVKEIISFKKGPFTSQQLGIKYNVAASTIRSIWQNKNWKHL